jgi:hypothetical protein
MNNTILKNSGDFNSMNCAINFANLENNSSMIFSPNSANKRDSKIAINFANLENNSSQYGGPWFEPRLWRPTLAISTFFLVELGSWTKWRVF